MDDSSSTRRLRPSKAAREVGATGPVPTSKARTRVQWDDATSPNEVDTPGMWDVLRERLAGDYAVDDFGFDPEFTDKVLMQLVRPFYRKWFRVEVSGIDAIPSDGGALVVANHSERLPSTRS